MKIDFILACYYSHMNVKKQAMVFTIGFTIDYLVKAMTNRGIKGNEEVVLISTLATDEFSKKRAEETLRYALDYISKLGLKYFIKHLDIYTSFNNVVYQIHEVLRDYDELEIYLIGGMRILSLASYYYAILISPFKKVKVISYTENMDNSYELPTILHKLPESEELMKLLEELHSPKEIKEIANNLGKSISTISKQLDKVSDLIDCEEGRPKKCKLNEIGKILVEEGRRVGKR